MKKSIISLAILVATLTSCNDYIEEENLSSVPADIFYKTAAGYESLVIANYSQLREIYGDQAWLFCAGTDLYVEGRNVEPIGLSQYTQLSPSTDMVGDIYSDAYKAIQRANAALHYAPLTVQTPDIAKRVAEMKYLRANAYFLLVQTYGGVSIIDTYIESPILSFERNSAEEVYAYILTDLNEALASAGTQAYDGRVNKRAVQDLLAKVYLTRGYETFAETSDYANAAKYADEAIAGQKLDIPFETFWKPGNEMNKETVFSVQFSAASQATDPNNLGNRQNSYFGSYMGGSDRAAFAPYRTYTLLPTDFAIGLYEKDDTRWKATFMTEVFSTADKKSSAYYNYYRVADKTTLNVVDYYAPKWETLIEKDAYMLAHPTTIYHAYGTYGPNGIGLNGSTVPTADFETISVKKFDDPTAPYGSNGSKGRVSTRDIILSRLGETYLVAAEAYLYINPATGLDRLNEVRSRAKTALATSAEFNIDYILDERARELLGEYHRWFDLKRTNKLIERASLHNKFITPANFNGNNGEKKILRPIPQQAIDLNQNKNFKQNPAYN